MKQQAQVMLGFFFILSLSASAALVVDYTRDTSGNVTARPSDSRTRNGETWNFSDTNYLLDSTGAGITNAQIYGGITTSWSEPADYSPLVRFNIAKVHVQVRAPSLTDNQANGVLIWKKADFISHASEQLRFASGDSMSVNILEFAGDPRGKELRFVVQQDGVYYVSSTAKTKAGKGAFSIADVSQEAWALLDTDDYTYGPFSAQAIDDIDAVGIFIAFTRTGAPVYFGFDDFQVNATAGTGEPGTLGLIL